MRTSTFLALCLLLLSSCSHRGNVPNYILTDSPESKAEIQNHNQSEEDSTLKEL